MDSTTSGPTMVPGTNVPVSQRLYGRPLEPDIDRKPRCACGKVLAWHVTRPWSIRCDRCGATNGRT